MTQNDPTPSPCPECGSTAASHFCTGKPYDSAPYSEYTYTEVAADTIPLTPEEVEKKKENALIEWIEELIIESLYCMGCEWCAERSEYCDSCEWKIAYCRSLRTRAEQAEAQLKTRTEDAERMAGALEKCKTLVPDRTVDCHGDKCRLPNCEACWSTAREYVRTTAVQFIDTTLSSLHHIYPPKQ